MSSSSSGNNAFWFCRKSSQRRIVGGTLVGLWIFSWVLVYIQSNVLSRPRIITRLLHNSLESSNSKEASLPGAKSLLRVSHNSLESSNSKEASLPGAKSLLAFEQFSSRFNCDTREEPSITASISPYKTACKNLINQSTVRWAVASSEELVGISVTNNTVTAFDWHHKWRDRLNNIISDLSDLANMVELPNVDIVMSLHDGPYFEAQTCIPVFVQEKSKRASGGIMTPPRSTTGFTHYQRALGAEPNVNIAVESKKIAFRHKQNRAFFRGTPTGRGGYDSQNWRNLQRSKIVQLSLDHPNLLDARFSQCSGIDAKVCQEMIAANFTGQSMPHSEQWQFKLIVVPDGNSVPDRLMSFLASNVVVLKPDSEDNEYWYPELLPYRHYIPFKKDTSDLIDVISSVLQPENNSLLERVAEESTLYVLKRLNPEKIRCYWALLLREYSSIFQS